MGRGGRGRARDGSSFRQEVVVLLVMFAIVAASISLVVRVFADMNAPRGRGGALRGGGAGAAPRASPGVSSSSLSAHYSDMFAEPWPSTSLGASAYFQRSWHAGTDEGVDCATLRRVGPRGDGGKALCLDGGLDARGLVVSVGVGNDWGFETALHRLCPTCPIEVFDGTNFGFGPARPPAFVDFHDEDFTPETWRRFVGRRVEVLKIDCEGCEFSSLPPFVERLSPRLILVEIHGNGHEDEADALLRKLNTTHGIYYREPNMEFTDGGCIEFAMKRRGAAAPLGFLGKGPGPP